MTEHVIQMTADQIRASIDALNAAVDRGTLTEDQAAPIRAKLSKALKDTP